MTGPSIYCPFCHRHTAISPATSVAATTGVYAHGGARWFMMRCNNCRQPILYEATHQEVIPSPRPQPAPENIPEPMRSDLTEAKNCLANNCLTAAAIMARRVMQTVCLSHGAPKGSLDDQMAWMLQERHITPKVKGWADSVRWLGNLGAHPEKEEIKTGVSKLDAQTVSKAVSVAERFLVVLYVTDGDAQDVIAVAKPHMANKA